MSHSTPPDGSGDVEISYDSDSLEQVSGALRLLHEDLQDGSAAGSLTHFRERALLPVGGQWGFGDPRLSRSVHVAAEYHHDVATAVAGSYADLLAGIDGLVTGLTRTVGNQRESEQANEATIARLSDQVDTPVSGPPRVRPVAADGSFA